MLDQLALGIRLHDEATFNSFLAGDNEEVISSLRKLTGSATTTYIYLYGPHGVGKSHLLQASCHSASKQNLLAFYLPLSPEFTPHILEDLERFELVCIDNIDHVAGDAVWEEALFYFFNNATINKTHLLFAASELPKKLPFRLLDLISRLASGITYCLKPLTDSQKLAALQMRSKIRGFELSDEVGQYLLNHYPRDVTILFGLLEVLDQASLKAKHKLTVPFVKEILKQQEGRL